jgi:hypothetical protein
MGVFQMKSICMFCGRNHKAKRPLACEIKGAASGALMDSIEPGTAMLILDKSKFLSDLEKRMKKVIRSQKTK